MNCSEGSVGLTVYLEQTVPKLGQPTGQGFRDDLQALIPILPSLWSGTMALLDRSPGQIPG